MAFELYTFNICTYMRERVRLNLGPCFPSAAREKRKKFCCYSHGCQVKKREKCREIEREGETERDK